VAAFVVVLAVAGIYLATAGDDDQVAETTPNTETMTDLEVIEAGVHAVYSGDADRAVELFELARNPYERDDEWIRGEVAYQAAIEGRVTLDCNEGDTPGVFSCTWLYHNAITDAIGYVDSGAARRVVVDDGTITAFGYFPFHDSEEVHPVIGGLRAFLGEEGESADSDSLCVFGYPYTQGGDFTPECVDFVLDHLDEWAAWAEINLELPGPNDG
jgi:hypothetical protein